MIACTPLAENGQGRKRGDQTGWFEIGGAEAAIVILNSDGCGRGKKASRGFHLKRALETGFSTGQATPNFSQTRSRRRVLIAHRLPGMTPRAGEATDPRRAAEKDEQGVAKWT